MTTELNPSRNQIQWLQNMQFDVVFILGVLLLGCGLAFSAVIQPNLLWPIITINLWLLGYHHVVATYTRLCFDRESFRQSKFLIFGVGAFVIAVTMGVLIYVGMWAIFSIYFYWQWWHYSRQSWGISRAYRAKDRNRNYEDGWLDQAIFYALPITGIIFRSHQDPDQFLGTDLFVIPTPQWLLVITSIIAVILITYWVLRRLAAWRAGQLAIAHTLYLVTHFIIYLVAYIVIEDITTGWLAINVWHNAQYILFVYMYNTNRFKKGVDTQKRFLSYISQKGRAPLYFGVCMAITGIYYVAVLGNIQRFFFVSAATGLVIYQMVNFHHYIVDSVIWKMRKPKVRKNVGIET